MAKKPRKRRTGTKPVPTTPPQEDEEKRDAKAKKELLLERRLQFRELQLGLFARSLKPADFPFDPKAPEDVRA